MEKFPQLGEHVEARQAIHPTIGGNAANFAVCLAKTGSLCQPHNRLGSENDLLETKTTRFFKKNERRRLECII